MIKTFLKSSFPVHLPQLYRFSKPNKGFFDQGYKKPPPSNQPQPLSVDSILNEQKKDALFVYKNTKQVCQFIAHLFQSIPMNHSQNLNQLTKLMKGIHLSSFSSWKALHQTSTHIFKSINHQLLNQNAKFTQTNLNLLLSILHSLNYQLDADKDRQFLQKHIFPSILFDSKQLDHENLQTLSSFSTHPVIFSKLLQQNLEFQEVFNFLFLKTLKETSENDWMKIHMTKIIKNGIYQQKWNHTMLESIADSLNKKQNLQASLKGLLHAIWLNSHGTSSIKPDEWTEVDNSNTDSKILTESKIINMLKELGYEGKANQYLFNHEVDYKIGQKFIVEFHGIHHYAINTPKAIQQTKSAWKVQAFRNRGYQVFVIPFYIWNKLQTPYQKKAWLIQNMEEQFLKDSKCKFSFNKNLTSRTFMMADDMNSQISITQKQATINGKENMNDKNTNQVDQTGQNTISKEKINDTATPKSKGGGLFDRFDGDFFGFL